VDGTPFGRYRLVEVLGRGGMGEVWRAYDTTIKRVVALKLLPPSFADDPVFQERFRREAHAAAGLDEPHVVPIYDFGEIDGQLYVTMRLINGRDLQTILAEGPLSAARAVAIIEQVAQAVYAAHKVGLVHRDIKPSNILLDDNDFAYLIDFGIARAAGDTGLTSTGTTIGTWSYMAPERFQSGTTDARADIYALACVLYEALTGQPPFPGNSLEQVAVAHMLAPPPRPSREQDGVPTAMDNVIATGMAKDPDQRYATTVELAHAARDATTVPLPLPGSTTTVRPPGRPDRLTGAPIDLEHTQLTAPGAAPWLPPPPGGPPPLGPPPTARRRVWRPWVTISALVAVAVLIAGGIFAAVKLSHHNNPLATVPPAAAPPPNPGPFTGTYAANFAPETDPNGQPVEGSQATTETWGIRSVCRSGGCVATASRRTGQTTLVTTLVFDDVGGPWLAVGLGSRTCHDAPYEDWEVFALQPHPDAMLAGEYSTTTSNSCGRKRSVTFTRTGDVDVASLPDPATQPPRVVSPAEALRGTYHDTVTENGHKTEYDEVVRTDCLRTGDRCMSFFHGSGFTPLVFGSGTWTVNRAWDLPCPNGGTYHETTTGQFPAPAPPQDPIALLTGRGHNEVNSTCVTSGDFDEKFVRTGD
jgi:serine/threonine-protein kinase